jgi:hypothetical protein
MSVDNRKVLMSRAPMTTPSVMRVRVIKDNDPFADMIEADTCYISPLANVRDAGDCDGDNRTFCDAEDSNLELTTVSDVINNVVERTGSDQLVPGGAYWGDHYNVPSAKAIAKKRGLGLKNLSLDNGKYRKSLPGMLEGSTLMFQEAVGWVHLLFLTSDLYLNLVWSLEKDLQEVFAGWKPVEFSKNHSLILILAEIYEVPLGGLSWDAYDVIFDYLIPLVKGGLDITMLTPEQMVSAEEKLNAADMNGSCGADIFAAATMVANCREISKSGELPELFDTPEAFLRLTAELAVLISKGKLNLKTKPHRAMVDMFQQWIATFDSDLFFVNKNITLMQVQEFVTTVAVAMNGEAPEIDLDYFDC